MHEITWKTFLHKDVSVQDVFHALASKGQQTLEGIVRLSVLPKPAVRSALLVLLQHSFVTSQLVQPEASLKGTPPPFFLYTADTTAALHVLRSVLYISPTLNMESQEATWCRYQFT